MTNFLSLPQLRAAIANIDPVAYGKTRNFLNGKVSRLSPYVSRGVISTKQIMESVLKNGYKPFVHEKLMQQLAWRDYFQRVLQQRPDLHSVAIKREQGEDGQRIRSGIPKAVQDASTGIEGIDRSIQELYQTGFMHNHARMYVASVVTNVAGGDWRDGARWMYYHLLDADVASNGCSWQWVCSAFSSKKYYANQENINRYAGTRQTGTFLDVSYEELPEMEVPENLKPFSQPSFQTNLPIGEKLSIDPSLPTYIYTFYNLDPYWHAGENANRILLLEPSHFVDYPVSDQTIKFILFLKDSIPDMQVYVGEYVEMKKEYTFGRIIAKEHPLFSFSGAVVEPRDWMFPEVSGYFPSFFGYWKKCERFLYAR
jgi:deoxyribodipyrimidine photo-lyase